MSFLDETKQMTTEDIELILEDQTQLYSKEEIELLKDELSSRQKEELVEKKSMLPKEIECPKCEGINPSSNENCQFCGYKIGDAIEEIAVGEDYEKSNTSLYIISLILPFIELFWDLYILQKIKMSWENHY
jgi:ribosomal protein L40E